VTIRTLIVEDEPLARQRLRQCLEDEADVEVVRECEDGRSAARAIRELSPDLVFLDIQIPELNGFAVLREVLGADPGAGPLVVIVTAYGEYALQGFEVNALDYLLKPFDEDRFRETMRRVRDNLGRSRDAVISRTLLDAFDRYRDEEPAQRRPSTEEPAVLTRLVVRDGGRVFFVKTTDIHWIEAAGNYARAHMGSTSHLIRTSLKELGARLPLGQFARIHRGVIVNLEYVKEIQPYLHGDYRVLLNDGTVLRMSRRYRHELLSGE
jgi:two-component system LytT family response regulator